MFIETATAALHNVSHLKFAGRGHSSTFSIFFQDISSFGGSQSPLKKNVFLAEMKPWEIASSSHFSRLMEVTSRAEQQDFYEPLQFDSSTFG